MVLAPIGGGQGKRRWASCWTAGLRSSPAQDPAGPAESLAPRCAARRACQRGLAPRHRSVEPRQSAQTIAVDGGGSGAGAGHGHRSRLPTGGDVRPVGGGFRCAVCGQRRQPGPVLLHAQCGVVAQPGPQGCVRDTGHRRVHQRARGPHARAAEPGGGRGGTRRRGRTPGGEYPCQAQGGGDAGQGPVLPPAGKRHRRRVRRRSLYHHLQQDGRQRWKACRRSSTSGRRSGPHEPFFSPRKHP